MKMRNTPDDPPGPKPHDWNAELMLVNEEFQRPIDYIAYVNKTNETTIMDIFNKLPRMSLDHIHSIHTIDENKNLTFLPSYKNDDFLGYAAGQCKANFLGLMENWGLMRQANNRDHWDTDRDQCFFEGQYVDGNQCGYGRQICMRGTCYDGMFQANDCEGEGKLVYKNGTIQEGLWKAGVLVQAMDLGGRYFMCDYETAQIE